MRLRFGAIIGGVAVLSVAALVWLGYGAVTEWQRSAELLARRRADAAADLLVTALTRDMRGVQSSVLAASQRTHAADEYDLIAGAFARYPYPEVFFEATDLSRSAEVTFYGRAERMPRWMPSTPERQRMPVATVAAPSVGALLARHLARDVAAGHRYAIVSLELEGVPYQVVAQLQYSDIYREHLSNVFGFMVNLPWVSTHYFRDVAAQVSHIAGSDGGVVLSVLDSSGAPVTSPPVSLRRDATGRRTFPLAFFDPNLQLSSSVAGLQVESWTAEATVVGDPTMLAANQGAQRTLAVAALTAILLGIGFVLTLRAARASTELTRLRSDFVATVTHELKTPIATIRAISETLASGRLDNTAAAKEYAQMAVQEAKRLTRLIDNLLAYSRVTDVTEVYSFEAMPPEQLVEDTVHEFAATLAANRFDVHVDVEPGLPPVRIDRTALALALANLLDNAIRYSGESRYLRIHGYRSENGVVIEVIDRGVGIPEAEISQVTRRFYRGHRATAGGSGLGLAITQRIVRDHGGELTIRSEEGHGTTVGIELPATEEA